MAPTSRVGSASNTSIDARRGGGNGIPSKRLDPFRPERAQLGDQGVIGPQSGHAVRDGRNVGGVYQQSRATGHLRPFVQLTNIASTVYQEIPGVVMPQRSFIAGIEYTLGRSSK